MCEQQQQVLYLAFMTVTLLLYFLTALWVYSEISSSEEDLWQSLNSKNLLFVQVIWPWDGGELQWEGWACFLTLILPNKLSQRMPSGTRWRMVKSCDGCPIIPVDVCTVICILDGTLCKYNSERLSCHRVCDRGTKHGQGTRCPVNKRPNPSHPRPSNELWREETYQVGFDWQAFKGDMLPCQCHSWHRVNHYTLLRTKKQGLCKDKVVLQYECRESQTHIHIALLFQRYIAQEAIRMKMPRLFCHCGRSNSWGDIDFPHAVIVTPNYLHRSQVLAFKSAEQSHRFTCFADCSENVSLVSVSSIIKQYA